MTTLMIRLDYPPPGDHLVVRGFTIQHGDRGWHEDIGPVKEMPRGLPLVATEVSDQRVRLEDVAGAILRSPGSPVMSPSDVGRALWRVINDGAVGTWWTEQIATAQAPVRTILDIQHPDLRSLPWELMTPPVGKPVFRDADNPWVRSKPNWPPLDELAAPVQVLVVVAEEDAEGLRLDDELDAIHRCVREKPGSWHVQVLTAPSSIAVFRQVYEEFDPHVLHVIGHTVQRDGQRVLKMVPADGDPWALTVDDVSELPTPAPRLVVLNCCRTSQAGAMAEPAWGFSEAFLDLGSAAVVTMQGDIPSVASVGFTSRFYRDLVAGRAIDAAAARARLEISDLMRKTHDYRSWALPSLLVTTDPDRVLPVRECLTPAELSIPPFLEVFGKVPGYVDRSVERRTLLRALDAGESRVLVLTGQPKDGRSAVLRSTLLTLRLRGRNTVYVDLDAARRSAQGRKLSWLTVLRLIRDAIWTWVPELDDEPRQRFGHELSYLIGHRDPEPWSATAAADDPGHEFPAEGEDHQEWISKIVVAFRRMLVAVATEHPLLVALDSLSAIHDEDLRDVLAEQLLLPLVTGRSRDGLDADVRCLAAASADELTVLPEAYRRPLEQTRIEIKPFRRAEVPRLVGEYIARHGLDPGKTWRQGVEQTLQANRDEGLKPGQFSDFLTMSAGLLP